MAEIKTILALTKEADARDLPYLTTIKDELIIFIDAANLAEIEYKVVYDLSVPTSGLPPLQIERLKLKIHKTLQDKSYIAEFNDLELTITWTIATLKTSL